MHGGNKFQQVKNKVDIILYLIMSALRQNNMKEFFKTLQLNFSSNDTDNIDNDFLLYPSRS